MTCSVCVCFCSFTANLGMEGWCIRLRLFKLVRLFTLTSLSLLMGLSFGGWRYIFFCNFAESFQLITYSILSSHVHFALNLHICLFIDTCITLTVLQKRGEKTPKHL